MSRGSMKILGGAVLMAGAVMLGSRSWELHNEAELRLREAKLLEAHDQFLRAEIKAGAFQIGELKDALQSASNQVAEVGRQLEVENKTHDPIRAQIEKMLTEQISMRETLTRREKTLAGVDAALNAARKTNEALRVESGGQRDQIAKLEGELKAVNERAAAMSSQLNEAQTSAAGLKTKLEQTQRCLAESEHLAGELQKQKQDLEAVATTNSTSTVSSP